MPRIKEDHTDIVFARVDLIVSLILENPEYMQTIRKPELVRLVMLQVNCAQRTAERYIQEAKKIVRNLAKERLKNAFERSMQDREYLVRLAKGKKDKEGKFEVPPDTRLLLDIMKDRDRLLGLYTENIHHTGTINVKNVDFQKMTDEQLAELEKKVKNNENVAEYLESIGIA